MSDKIVLHGEFCKMELLRMVYNYFSPRSEIEDNTPESPLSMIDVLNVLNAPEPVVAEEPIEEIAEKVPENQCFEASGKVTFVSEQYGLIDRNLYFEHEKISTIKEGMTVQYLAYKRGEDVKISKILFIKQDDWNEATQNIPRPICERVEIGQVIERKNRMIYVLMSKATMGVDLNKVESEFVPMVGDWLSMQSVVEIDENIPNLFGRILEIIKISPLRSNVIEGYIKLYDRENNYGQVNRDVLFYKEALAPGYAPVLNDKVSVEIIESENGKYTWRALKVLPSGVNINKYCPPTLIREDKNLLEDKNGIILTSHISVNLQNIGETQIISFEIRNVGNEEHYILNIYIKINSDKQQINLEKKITSKLAIKAGQSRLFNLKCQAKFFGTTNEMIVVNFDGFSIGRLVKIQVIPFHKTPETRNSYHKNGKHLATAAWKSYQTGNREIVGGQRPIKPPSFIAKKLPVYEIPEHFVKHVFALMAINPYLNDIPIKDVTPCLGIPLDVQNYTDVFHYLLYLEEMALQVNIRRYDLPLANFIKHDEFLMLEVPDLAERRPSVIVGDKVIAFNPLNKDSKPLEGHVHKTGKCHLYLKFNQNFHNVYKGEDYKVEFHCSRTNFRRYHQAIDLASRNLGKKILFPSVVVEKDAQISFIDEDDVNKNTKYARIARKSLKKSSSDTESEDLSDICDKLRLEWFDKKLNIFQKAAVKNILLGVARPLPYFIFGPPGTGKTVTLIETILQIIRMMPNSRLLVCAPSNSAADLIALRLLESGVLLPGDLARMVAYRCITEGTIPQKLIPYCVTGDLAREGSRESRHSVVNGVSTNLSASALGRHRVTVGTCMVVGILYSMGFNKGHFTHIIVDEAGQAMEPELMIPLSLMDISTSQTVLAGDPMQLGPCVFSLIGKEYGLGDSYFERVISRFPYNRDAIGFPNSGGYDPRLVTRLVFNYRSLPELLTCPNDLFYQNELRATISAEDSAEAELLRRVGDILPKREGKLPPAFVFHGVRGQNYQTPDCPSWYNPIEAGQVFFYLNDLYKLGVKPEEIGIITPYIRQGQHVRELLLENNMDLPKIGSVEEFQGQEFKVVILSCVRSNEHAAHNDSKYGLGFIASPRRLNVAISRSQALLIIIGNPFLLLTDNYWRAVLLYAISIGGYTGCDCPNILNEDNSVGESKTSAS